MGRHIGFSRGKDAANRRMKHYLSLMSLELTRQQVEIQVELEELEMDGRADGGEVFPLDIFDVVLGQEGEENESDSDSDSDGELNEDDLSSDAASDHSNSDGPHEEKHMDTKNVRDMVTKLDNILEVVFKHLKRMHFGTNRHPSPPSDSQSRTSTPTPTLTSPAPYVSPALLELQQESRFSSLLAIFTRTILRTFKSRYTQFLLFWYTSLSNSFRDRFLGTVVSHALLEQDLPIVTRAAAASYVASYVSRAVFVDRKETQAIVGLVCEFLEAHLDVFDRNAGLAPGHPGATLGAEAQSVERHVVFYAATQAVFLIFCFRWRDLMEGGDDVDEAVLDLDELSSGAMGSSTGTPGQKTWISQLSVLQRVINSPLNPLKVSDLLLRI